MLPILTLLTVTTLSVAQPQCDPLNQYEEGGHCCNMCGPGTYMTSLGTCLEPQCYPCDWNEYQEGFTKEPRCHIQPYCDTNVFFQEPTHDKEKKTTCLCKEGYHCATKRCLVCQEHTRCGPGQVVRTNGTHEKDTVCEECPPGTYSESALGECKEWTECEPLETLQRGTNTEDNICGRTGRTRLGLIAFISVLLILVFIALLTIWLRRDKFAKRKYKNCREDPAAAAEEQLKNTTAVQIYFPQCQPEDCPRRTPEENVHELFESASEVGLTEKGQCVVQENGKAELLSRQESQTQHLASEGLVSLSL